MSDSLPQDGGPGPFDGWDLEGLLSGAPVWLPRGMRPVAATLDSLRSAPAGAELAGEAAARAAFRQAMPSGAGGPAGRPGGRADNASTLIMPGPTAGAGPRVVTRPRHAHRRPRRRGRWSSRALAGALGGAAVAVIAGGVALAGGFSGGHPGLLGRAAAASPAPRASRSGSTGLEGNATKEPASHPAPSRSAGRPSSAGSGAPSTPGELCRQYLDFFAGGASRSDGAAEGRDYQRLSELAGGSWHVLGYCMKLQPWALTPDQPGSKPGGLGFPPSGPQSSNPGGSYGQDGNSGNGNGNGNGQQGGNGHGNGQQGGNGNGGGGGAGNGNGRGVNRPGFGGQGKH